MYIFISTGLYHNNNRFPSINLLFVFIWPDRILWWCYIYINPTSKYLLYQGIYYYILFFKYQIIINNNKIKIIIIIIMMMFYYFLYYLLTTTTTVEENWFCAPMRMWWVWLWDHYRNLTYRNTQSVKRIIMYDWRINVVYF